MDSLTEAREHLRGIHDILDDIEAKSEKVDLEVSRQKSRLFKAWCLCWYGHLYDKAGICKRCGIKKPIKS